MGRLWGFCGSCVCACSFLALMYLSFLTLCRKTICEGPDYRDPVPGKPSALQQALMKFADRTSAYIINPAVGTEFDNCDEAYEYYNLYSWECGFGIRWGKKRWSEKKRKKGGLETKPYQLAQEFYCSCRVCYELNSFTIKSGFPASKGLCFRKTNKFPFSLLVLWV